MTRFAELRHSRTAYDREGDGLPLLLVHGAEATRESFAALSVALLAQHEVPLCVIRYDQRECGETVGDGRAHGIPDLAEDAAELMARLGFARYAVLGTSLGGRVAQQLAVAHAGQVETLCLVNTWPLDRQLTQLNPEGTARLHALRERLPGSAAELAAMFYTAGHVARHPQLARRFAHPPAGSRRGALAHEVHPFPAERIDARTLCISGTADPVVPTAVVRELAGRMPGAQFRPVASIGHSMAVQAPEFLADLIASFLRAGDPERVPPFPLPSQAKVPP